VKYAAPDTTRRDINARLVSTIYDAGVRTVKRIALAIGAVVGAVVYVWFAAVRAVPLVRRRKADRRSR
jgi:hypothetical protein